MELSPLPVKRKILNDLQYFNKTDIKITILTLTIHANKCIIEFMLLFSRSVSFFVKCLQTGTQLASEQQADASTKLFNFSNL
jgi:hypothetical protein